MYTKGTPTRPVKETVYWNVEVPTTPTPTPVPCPECAACASSVLTAIRQVAAPPSHAYRLSRKMGSATTYFPTQTAHVLDTLTTKAPSILVLHCQAIHPTTHDLVFDHGTMGTLTLSPHTLAAHLKDPSQPAAASLDLIIITPPGATRAATTLSRALPGVSVVAWGAHATAVATVVLNDALCLMHGYLRKRPCIQEALTILNLHTDARHGNMTDIRTQRINRDAAAVIPDPVGVAKAEAAIQAIRAADRDTLRSLRTTFIICSKVQDMDTLLPVRFIYDAVETRRLALAEAEAEAEAEDHDRDDDHNYDGKPLCTMAYCIDFALRQYTNHEGAWRRRPGHSKQPFNFQDAQPFLRRKAFPSTHAQLYATPHTKPLCHA